MIFVGAENILSPLGKNAKTNFEALAAGQSGIRKLAGIGNRGEDLYVSSFGNINEFDLVQNTVFSIIDSLEQVDERKLEAGRTLLLLSTTKGEINRLMADDVEGARLDEFRKKVVSHFPWITSSQVISNACISGVLALVVGHDLIVAGEYDHVIVSGADMLSGFTIAGFQSFFAISDQKCQPFDKKRTGINLGEAAGTIILSKDETLFDQLPFKLLGGSSANDANHISGPSRTGEGLYRSIVKTLKVANIQAAEVDFLSAHGTGTAYNDEMESIAFERAGLLDTPLNSLKGFYGHTFGAAGIIESAVCLQSMRNSMMIGSEGFNEQGTSRSITVLRKNEPKILNVVLKTASGFGGCNASLLFSK